MDGVLEATSTPAAMPRWRVWLLASRPATLTAAVAPVLVGGALALRTGQGHAGAFGAALAGALLLQLGCNYANDVFDFEKGADTAARQGPLRVTQAGLLQPAQVRRGMGLALGLATLCGAYLVHRSGWPIVWLGLASLASAVAYTGGPWPLGYLGLGDVFVFGFFGLAAVCGTVFVQAGHVPAEAWPWAVAVGATCTAILVVNNLRDADTDAVAGKRTLAVRFGRRAARLEYAGLFALAIAVAVAQAVARGEPWLLLPLVALPPMVRLVRTVAGTQDGPTLNATLGRTARVHLLFGLLAALALAGTRP